MKVISEKNLRETVGRFLDAQISQQKEVRDYWTGKWDMGEGDSSLHCNNMTTAQNCIDFLLALKRGVTCEGCKVKTQATQLETEVYLLRQELFSKSQETNKSH